MKTSPNVGIANVLNDDAKIIHSTVLGKAALGRVGDLIFAWCEQDLKVEPLYLSDIRVLIQALLEFACPSGKNGLGQIELGESDGFLVIATRFQNVLAFSNETIEKDLTEYWLNSEQAKLIRRLISHDRVEVRFHPKLNLIEWRVYRALKMNKVVDQVDQALLFEVLTDSSNFLGSESGNYVDLGDLPFQDWLNDVYKNRQEKSNAGEIAFESGVSQNDSEYARITIERESAEIDESIKHEIKGSSSREGETDYRFSPSEEDNAIDEKSEQYSNEMVEKLLLNQSELKQNIKVLTLHAKKTELKNQRELIGFQLKAKKFEELLNCKELSNQKSQLEIRILQQKLDEDRENKKDEIKSNHFKEKALEMFEMLKKIKKENEHLEKIICDSRNKEKAVIVAGQVTGDPTGLKKQVNELVKKVERTGRAFDAEKVKVKGLSDRLNLAEKEAQSASSIVKDLESKFEHSMTTEQLHKKETEQVKQKLVQSEAEKNRIKNELVKAQAQLQTLIKRQAS